MYKIILLLASIVVVKGLLQPGHGYGHVAAAQAVQAAAVQPQIAVAPSPVVTIEPYDPNPQYTYSYNVQDPSTGDYKNQQETRHGNIVRGQYSLLEPDGTRRVVQYTAGPLIGFNAVVHRNGLQVLNSHANQG